MTEIWDLLVVGYFIVMGAMLFMIVIKFLIPHHIFSIDDVCEDKNQVFLSVKKLIEDDMGVKTKRTKINFNYNPNDDWRGLYDQSNNSITIYLQNTITVHSFVLTLIEEIHHSIFVSTLSGIKIYQIYNQKVGYDKNPLEYSAKVYAMNQFKSIHRNLKKQGLISYKV